MNDKILPVQEFLSALIEQLPAVKDLVPDSLFAERLASRQLSPDQITKAHEVYYRLAAEDEPDPVAVWKALDELVRGTEPYQGSQEKAVGKANADIEARREKMPFRILGTANDGQTYFIDRSERVQALRLGSLTKTQLQLLAPITWWISMFQGSRGRLEVDSAIDFVIEAANGTSFELANLRGRGCWREATGEICYHDGQHTYGKTNPCRIYQKKTRLDMGLEVDPAAAETRADMWNAAASLSFETPADCTRLLAWAVLAPFCGALPARPAGFLTGASKSGKSTVLTYVVTRLAQPMFISGESTAAYVRQESGNDRQGVVIDEAEAHDEESRRRMNDLFSLMRQSTFEDSPKIGKGSQTGRPQTYGTGNIYLYSAISPGMERTADLNRFFIVDLKRPENDWPTVRDELIRQFTPENCAAVRAFTWKHLEEIIDGAHAIALAVEEVTGMSSRDALLEAILWAAHWRVWKNKLPEDKELRDWLKMVYEVKERQEVEDDAESMLNRLLTEVVPVFDAPTKRYTLDHCLRCVLTGMEETSDFSSPITDAERERYKKTCWQFGLYVLPKTREVAVAKRRPAIARILQAPLSYHITVARHPLCVDKDRPVTQDGPTKRCVIFSSGILEGEAPF